MNIKIIRETRKIRGISLQRLSKSSGVSRNIISRIERGRNVSVAKIEAVLNALGMEIVIMIKNISNEAD